MVSPYVTVKRVVDPVVLRMETEIVSPSGPITVLDLARGGWRPFQDFAVHNGQHVPAYRWSDRVVSPGDEVVFPGTPRGIGVAVGAYVAAQAFPSIIYSAATIAVVQFSVALVVNLAIAIAASALIRAIVGEPSSPTSVPGDTFSFEGVRTVSVSGQPIPIIYGEQVAGGNIIGSYVREGPIDTLAETTHGFGDPVVSLTIGLCEGPVESIAGITAHATGLPTDQIEEGQLRVNGEEVSVLSGHVSTRRGTVDQTPIPTQRFTSQETTVSLVGIPRPATVSASNPYVPATTEISIAAGARAVDLTCEFPEGWWQTARAGDDNSAGRSRLFDLAVRYKDATSNTWDFPKFYDNDGNELRNANGDTFYSVIRTGALFSLSPFSVTGRVLIDESLVGVAKKMQVRILGGTETQPQDPQLFIFRSYRELYGSTGLAYPWVALLGLRYTPSSALRSVQDVTTRVKGKKIKVWDGVDSDPELAVFTEQYTSNPSDCLIDFLVTQRYGGGEKVTLRDIDLPSFKQWRDYCNEQVSDGKGGTMNRWELDYTIEGGIAFWDVVTQICACGRAQAIKVGSKISIAIDRPAAPTQLFTSANIIQDTFKIQYTATGNRPTRVEVQFKNRFKDFQLDVVSHSDESLLSDDLSNFRSETVSMPGISHPERALRLARYMVNASKFITRGIEFETRIDGLVSTPGSVIAVQHDLPKWDSIGAVVISSTSTTVKLDRPFTQKPDTRYRITVRTTGTGANVLQQRDLPVVSAETAWARNQAITVGAAWDVGDEPQQSDAYAIHELTEERPDIRLYKIISVAPAQPLTAKLVCLEYDERIYLDDGVAESASEPITASAPESDAPRRPGPLRVRQFAETIDGGKTVRSAWLSWRHPIGTRVPERYAVYQRALENTDSLDDGILDINTNEGWSRVGYSEENGIVVPGLSERDYQFAVVPVSGSGQKPAPHSARRTSIRVDYQPRAPVSMVSDLAVTQLDTQQVITWTNPDDPLIKTYEIRRGEQWQTAFVLGRAEAAPFYTEHFASGTDKILVRGISWSGVPSGKVASIAFAGFRPESWSTGTYGSTDFALDWTVAGSSFSGLTSSGVLLLFDGTNLTGTWTSPVYDDTGIGQDEVWKISARVKAAGRDNRSFWKFGRLPFSTWGSTVAREIPPVSRWRPRWRKDYVLRNAHGTLVPQFRYSIDWRFDSGANPTGSYIPLVQGVQQTQFSHSQYRITLERDSTDIYGEVSGFEVTRAEVV